MKRLTIASVANCTLLAILLASAMPSKNAIKKKGNTYIINTTSITKKIHGYAGATPLNIYITNNKIAKIETLPNQESPQFFERAKSLLGKFVGKNIAEVSSMQVDAVSGATYSSQALIKTVKGGVNYFQTNK